MRVDEGLQLLDEQAAVELGLAAHLYPRVSARRVLVDAFVAGVVDADDDYGLYRLRLDERLRRLVHAPVLPGYEGGRAVEEVLPVVQVEHRVAAPRLALVTGREVDQHVAVCGKELRVELRVRAEVARERVLRARPEPATLRRV